MIIITSAAYVGQEFQAELGKIPPCMLPIGNRRLFEHQAEAIKAAFKGDSIYLSLPQGYDVPEKDQELFARLDLNVVSVPEGLSLAESILYVINSIGLYDGRLRVLHGDTLILGFPLGDDVVGTAKTVDDYGWEVEAITNNDELVWCGYFAFSNIPGLVKALTVSRDSFVSAIRSYAEGNSICYSEADQWYDLGHVNTYFKSRARITTERAFNTIKIHDGCVIKSGEDALKIQAEANWFKSLPFEMKKYTPQFLGEGAHRETPYYKTEYLYLLPLNEFLVHAKNPPFFWKQIFDHCSRFFDACRQSVREEEISKDVIARECQSLFAEKTFLRLKDFSSASGLDIHGEFVLNGTVLPSVRDVASRCIELIDSKKPVLGITHGDFCLSNILFDSRSNAIKVIDPRGLNFNGGMTIYGDIRYDLGKLTHSIVGLYDLIISGAFTCSKNDDLNFDFHVHEDPRLLKIQDIFLNHHIFDCFDFSEIAPITVLLFLSMLPLHKDSPARQEAFLANAMRLYSRYVEAL